MKKQQGWGIFTVTQMEKNEGKGVTTLLTRMDRLSQQLYSFIYLRTLKSNRIYIILHNNNTVSTEFQYTSK